LKERRIVKPDNVGKYTNLKLKSSSFFQEWNLLFYYIIIINKEKGEEVDLFRYEYKLNFILLILQKLFKLKEKKTTQFLNSIFLF
jgi:hypothetical protein